MEASPPQPPPLSWPSDGVLSLPWITNLASTLEYCSRFQAPTALPSFLPISVADSLIAAASKLLHKEPNCLKIDVDPSSSCSTIVLVGDIHGQLHDLLHLLQLTGSPSHERLFIFNGDYVDRGAWGLETYLLLIAWKVLLPHRVFLLRGNHETKFCTSAYGFEQEVMVKYGDMGKHLYRRLLGCFEGHPLAAVIGGSTYMAHGGLFRHVKTVQPKHYKKGRVQKMLSSSSKSEVLTLGSLEELSMARRCVLNPSWEGQNVIPGDVLWSDPALEQGLSLNRARGIGLLWGPDCTQEFLEKNRLRLIVRSHEGPDAREKRPEMKGMDEGYTIDHVVKSGKLVTVFSAPDYPQFQASKQRYNNKGAYIVLEAPDFSAPNFFTFAAVHPRPKVNPYYDYVDAIDSDEELNLDATSEGSGGSDGDN